MNAVKNANLTTTESDVLGGARTVASDVYPSGIKMAYLDKNDNGTLFVVFDFAMLVDGKERNHKETIYISNKQGSFTYTDKKTGKEEPLPGYTTVDTICKMVVGKPLTELVTDSKQIKVYDYTQQAEVPMAKEVFMELIRGKLQLGLLEETVDKNAKDSTGAYVPTGETRDQNVVSKVFNEDGFTTLELDAKATETKFKDAWLTQYKGKKINKAKGAATGAKAGGVTKPAATGGALFG